VGDAAVTLHATPFTIIPEWLLYAEVNPRSVVLYGILRRYADKDGRCHPSRKRLAEKLRCTDRTITTLLQELVAVGAVTVEKRFKDNGDQLPNDYFLHNDPHPPGQPIALPLEGGFQPPQAVGFHPNNESQLQRDTSLTAGSSGLPNDPAPPAVNELVAFFVDQCRAVGITPTTRVRAEVGKQIKRLVEVEHKPDEVLRLAVKALAREAKAPKMIDYIVADAERHLAARTPRRNGHGPVR